MKYLDTFPGFIEKKIILNKQKIFRIARHQKITLNLLIFLNEEGQAMATF